MPRADAPLDPGSSPRVLPRSWDEAITRAATAPFLGDAFGAGFLKVWLAIKRQELARWNAEVTPTDWLWYLRDT